MDDSEISPKRRRLDNSRTDPGGKSEENASPMDKNAKVQGTEYCNKPNHHKEVKWNKQLRPEVRQCSQRIFENLKQTRLESNKFKSCEKAAVEPSMELPKPVKQDAGEDKISKASVLATNCPTLVVSHEVTLESPGNSKADTNSGCTVENQATSQKTSCEFSIPSTVNKDDVRDEIKKMITDRTRQVFAEAEKLQSRVSTLETENRNLKHKVKMLYKTIRGALTRHKEDLSTVASCMLRTEPQVQATDCKTMGLVPAAQNQPFSKVGILPADRNKPTSFDCEAVGKTQQKSASPPSTASISRSPVDHKNTYEPAGLVGTGSHSPSISLNKDTITPSAYLPQYLPGSSQTSYVQTKRTDLDDISRRLSSVMYQPHNVVNSSKNYNTTSIKQNPISVLNQVLEQILPDNSTALPQQATKLSRPKTPTGPNSCKMSLQGLTINRSEGELSQASPERSLSLSPLNAAYEKSSPHDKEVPSSQRIMSEFISSTSPKAFEVDIKSGMFLENTRQVASVGAMETKSIVTNSVKPRCSAFANTPTSVSEVQPNVALTAAPAAYFRKPEKSRADGKIERLLEDNHGNQGAKSFVANSEMPDSKSFANIPFSYSQIQPKAATSGTHFEEQKSFKADNKCRVLMENTFLVTSTAEKVMSPLTLATKRKHFYKDTPFAASNAQPKATFTASSDTSFSFLSQPTQIDGQDHNAPRASVCTSIGSIPCSTKGQKEGLMNNMSILAKAAGLDTNATNQIVYPVLSTPTPIPPFPGRRISNEITEQNNLDLNKQSVNNSGVVKDSVSFLTTPLNPPSQFYPPTATNSISEPYTAHEAHNCTTVSVNGTNMYKIANPVALHPNVRNADDKTSQRRYVKNPELTSGERSIFDLQRKANNNALVPQVFPICDLRFSAVSLNKYQMKSQSQQHKPRPFLAPNIVISKPRYHPYPPIREKGQEVHVLPLWSHSHDVPSIHERRSPKPQGTPTLDVALNSNAHSCPKQRPEFPDIMQMEGIHQKTYSGTSLSSKPSSVTESDKQDYRTPTRSLSSPSSKSNSRVKPHLEMSQSCQLYLNQLRRSAEARAISTGKFINAKPSHFNSAPQSEREMLNGNNGWQHNAQFSFQSGLVRQQREGYNHQPKVNHSALTTHGNIDNKYVMQHPNPRYLMFHHQKFTNKQRQKAFQGERSNPVCCEKPPETKQCPEEQFKEQNAKSELEICHPSLTEVSTEPRK